MSLVEHTSINPNKAAHIGHLRNAILGDTFVRLLRAAGQKVDVQNYIDNTGVQVADVVVGFLHLEGQVARRGARSCSTNSKRKGKRIDYYCWDLYAQHFAVVRAGKRRRECSAQEAALRHAARDRARRQRDGRNCRADLDRGACAAILKPCCGWTSSTIFCPARARFCTSSSGTRPSSS